MILGIGNDVIECDRIGRAIARKGTHFLKRILGEDELTACAEFNEHRTIEYAAGRFAAKESIAKALGCGLSGVAMDKLNIRLQATGLTASWVANRPQMLKDDDVLHISISHVRSFAFATAVWERREG